MKTILLGLDGATLDLVEPLAATGKLPVLDRLMREGVVCKLRSTLLPNSFPGWASCTTGTSEGMHGIFSPFLKQPGSYSVRAISALDIKTRTVWDLLGESGGRSMVLNVPTTYPPEPIHGLMVCGMLTPGLDSDFCHPASLKSELLELFPGYVTEPARHPDKLVRAEEFRHATEMHEQAAHFLLDHGDWDLFVVVFSVLDRVQHDFWADMDPSHPRHDARTPASLRGQIEGAYIQLDRAVGRFLDRLSGDFRVFIASDHGFCAELKEVRVNEVLAKAGLLTFKSPATRKARARLRWLGERVRGRLRPSTFAGNVLERKVHHGGSYLGEIDWRRTRAFFAQDKGVWVNLQGRESEGVVAEADFDKVVEEARAALLGLTCDEGQPVFESVMPRGEAFHGLGSVRLPDLVLVTRRDEWVYNERPGYGETVVPADTTTGTHARDGLLVAWGKGIKQGPTPFQAPPNLRDLGPTLLESLGCPLPEDMDGRFLSELFTAPSDPARKGTSYRGGPTGEAYGEADQLRVRERLRALGYID